NRCSSPRSPTLTMSAAAKAVPLQRRCSCAVSSARRPGCISICSLGRLPPNRAARKAANVRSHVRSTHYWPRAMADALDPRVTPARADIAAKHLEGKIKAARFIEGRVMEVMAPQAPLRREPRPDAPLGTEALKGERVTVYDTNAEGWAWGQLAGDHYAGWLPSAALAPPGPAPTHRVAALRTLVFPAPSIKLSPIE